MTDDRGQGAHEGANVSIFCLLSSIFCLLLASSQAWAAVPPLDLAEFGSGFEIPVTGDRVLLNTVFESPEGHLVFEAESFDNGISRVNFYDVITQAWLLSAPVTGKAKADAAERVLAKGGYAELAHMPMIRLSGGGQVYNHIHLKDVCFRPYAGFIVVAQPEKAPVERGIYFRLDEPQTIESSGDDSRPIHPAATSHSCHTSAFGTDTPLIANYRQESSFFFADNAGGFFVMVSRYVIHFEPDGHTDFFKGRDNPVFMSADETAQIMDILKKANDSREPQDGIKQVEAIIDQAAQAQKAAR